MLATLALARGVLGAAASELQVGVLATLGVAYLIVQVLALRWAATLPLFNLLALFQVGLVLFHLPGPMLRLAGVRSPLIDQFSNEELSDATLLVLLGMASVNAGIAFGLRWALRSSWLERRSAWLPHANRIAVAAAPVVAAPIVSLTVFRLVQLARSPLSYGELYEREVGLLDFVLVNFAIVGVAYLLVTLLRRGRNLAASVATLGTLAGLLALVGWRGTSAGLLLVGLWLAESLAGRRLPRVLILGVCVAFLGLFPLLRELRKVPADERLKAVSEGIAVNRAQHSEALAEMGETLRTVSYTIRFVPGEKAYAWGESYLWALARVVPNITGGRHPSTLDDRNPAQWLIWRVSPDLAQRGGAMGYSIVAETYYNFGWFGPALVLLPVGLLLGALVQWERSCRLPVLSVLVALVFFAVILGVRNDASMLFRTPVWGGLLPLLVFRVVGSHRVVAAERSQPAARCRVARPHAGR